MMLFSLKDSIMFHNTLLFQRM